MICLRACFLLCPSFVLMVNARTLIFECLTIYYVMAGGFAIAIITKSAAVLAARRCPLPMHLDKTLDEEALRQQLQLFGNLALHLLGHIHLG